MDETTIREHVQRHADAVVAGDMETVIGDFSEELRPHAPQMAGLLPKPVTAAEVESLEVGDPTSVAHIRYDGDDASLTIRSEWQVVDGRPTITAGAPV